MPATDPLDLVLTSLSVSGPTFGWVLLGVILRRLGAVGQHHIDAISRFAFRYALPVLLFCGAAAVDYSRLAGAAYLLAGVAATLVTLLAAWAWAYWRGFPRRDGGVFIQAAFRSNLAIVGLALCHAAYGDAGLSLAALPVAVMTALYNVLAVLVLNTTHDGGRSPAAMLGGMLRNPLLIGIFAGVLVALSGVELPAVVPLTGDLLSRYFLPLTLVAIGGSIQLNTLHRLGRLTWEAALWRLCVAPALAVPLALGLGVRDEPLGVIFLLLSAPVAAASFVMVVAARGNGTLAAGIVVLTTLLSCVTVTLGFAVLVYLGLVGQLV